jgi:hypothetical protein
MAMSKLQDIQFFHAAGHKDVVGEWEALFQHAKMGLQAAICYATSPGIDILSQAAKQLAHGDGFFVASVEYPTNIDALASLHVLAKGHVYIHLGYDSPRTKDEAQQDGYALMHSKLMLAEGYQGSKLWVGSHNLTARALSGANLEAGVLITADVGHQVIKDARAHLHQCRNSAERFDPERIDVYKQIQRRRMQGPIEVEPERILIIHAEAEDRFLAMNAPFNVHISVVHHKLDSHFAMDREVRLFLYRVGDLRTTGGSQPTPFHCWRGRQTGIIRTAKHPKNRGIEGSFPEADYQIMVPELEHAPFAADKNAPMPEMVTQVVIQLDGEVVIGSEVFPVKTGAAHYKMYTEQEPVDLGLDPRLRSAFAKGVNTSAKLEFQRIKHMSPSIRITTYERTNQPLRALGHADMEVQYDMVVPKHGIEPYFYVSKSVVRL